MPLVINLEHHEHNPHVPGTERRHALAAWLDAGASLAQFDEWWALALSRINFDNLRALCGLAWEVAWRVARLERGDGIDADPDLWFSVWWERNSWTWAPPTELTAELRALLGMPELAGET